MINPNYNIVLEHLFGPRELGNSVYPQTNKALPTYPSQHTVCIAKLFSRCGAVDYSLAPTSQRADKLEYLTAKAMLSEVAVEVPSVDTIMTEKKRLVKPDHALLQVKKQQGLNMS